MKSKYLLYEFDIRADVDVEIYMAEPIIEWQQTPAGKFCMEKGEDIEYHITQNPASFTSKVSITGRLSDKHATFHALKRT